MLRVKNKQKGYGGVVALFIAIMALVVTQFSELAAVMRNEARYEQQLRVVEGVDAIFNAYTSYFVAMCHQDDTNIPPATVTTLQDDGWLLLTPFNPSNASVSLDIDRPTITTSSAVTGGRSLNNSSTILHVVMTFLETNERDYLMFTDALTELGMEYTRNDSALTVDIQDQVINRRSSSEILKESTFRTRTCI